MRKTNRELKNAQAQLSHVGFRPPIHVIVREVYRAENKVTVQLVSTEGSPFDGLQIKDVKFPIMAPIDMSMSSLVKPGVEALLFYFGWQMFKGYVVLSHTEGTEQSVTYTPIRYSWSV